MALTKPSFLFLLSALLSESLVSSLLLGAAQLIIHSPEDFQRSTRALSPAQKSGVRSSTPQQDVQSMCSKQEKNIPFIPPEAKLTSELFKLEIPCHGKVLFLIFKY